MLNPFRSLVLVKNNLSAKCSMSLSYRYILGVMDYHAMIVFVFPIIVHGFDWIGGSEFWG